MDFSETWHDDKFWPNLKYGLKKFLKNLKNGYHGNQKANNVIFARKTLGAIDLKLGMYTQLHSGSNMGWVPPDHTSSIPM